MKLVSIERWFIRALTPTYTDLVERRLETQSKVMGSRKITQTNRFIVLLISLARYLLLVGELATARSRRAPQAGATLFWEHLPHEVAGRIPFLKWNIPNANFEGLSYADKICALPAKTLVGRVLLALLVTILASALRAPSELSTNLVRIARTCLLTLSRARVSLGNEIYLFEIYRTETPFVAAFLKERGIRVHLVAASAPLSFDSRVLIGDSLKACDPYQLDEFAYYRSQGVCNSSELWTPETFYRLAARYKGLTFDEHFDTCGVYTSGIQLRARLGNVYREFAERAILDEIALLEMVKAYASSHPSVRFVIFPHPLERRHYKKTGEYPLSKRFESHNIKLDLGADDSTLQFDQVGLGLTNFSSIGFERIHLGLRTIFYVAGLEYINWDIPSPYHKIFFTKPSDFVSAIDTIQKMSHHEFMNHYFGRHHYATPWLAENS